jgi:Na+/H+ antiporter NhaD/arsenite permease-like protein
MIGALLISVMIATLIIQALGATQGFVALCFSMVIVACNLGGAATPIGDFPAILLMGTGSISFVRYLILAFPMCILLFGVILVLSLVYYKKRGSEDAAPLERSLALIPMAKLYRNFTIDKTILYPGLGVFCSKLCYKTEGPCLFKCNCEFKP